MAFWNSAEVSQPPINTSQVRVELLTSEISLTKMNAVFANASSVLMNLNQLHVEAALLSRLIFKYSRRFHTDKGLQALRKVDHGLRQYLSINLKSIYATFSDTLPKPDESMQVVTTSKFIYLPTRQMLEWVLVRTQGFARLFCHIASNCVIASCFSLDRIRRGHMMGISTILMAIVGRIWSFSKYLIINACEWYSELEPYLNILNPHGMNWTPKNYTFPKDLGEWLNVPHITTKQNKSALAASEVNKVFASVGLSDDTPTEIKQARFRDSILEDLQMEEIDLGESISREEVSITPASSQESINRPILKKRKVKKSKVAALNIDSDLIKVSPMKKKKKKKTMILEDLNEGTSILRIKKKKKKMKIITNAARPPMKIKKQSKKKCHEQDR